VADVAIQQFARFRRDDGSFANTDGMKHGWSMSSPRKIRMAVYRLAGVLDDDVPPIPHGRRFRDLLRQ
jgi:hypothetical protein